MDRSGGQRSMIEFATRFAEAIAEGLLWEEEDHIQPLGELIKLGFLVEFDEEAIGFLMKTKNLQVFVEDETFLSSAFVLASSRETILLDNKWNRGILDCVPSAFISAFISLVKPVEVASASTLPHMFEFLPVNSSPYSELNAVRETISAKLVDENIVPCESYMEQKFFRKPSEVGRLMPAFWSILNNARKEAVSLHGISSHGRYVLSSSFDRENYDPISNFDEWYANCVRASNLVLGVSDEVYLELLLFLAEKWRSNFQNTNVQNIPLLKYKSLRITELQMLGVVNGFGQNYQLVAGTNDRPHLVKQDQRGSTACHYERKNTRETLDRQGITMGLCSVEDFQQHFGCKHKDAVKRLYVNISMFKSTCRQHQGYWWRWPCWIKSDEWEAFAATNNRAHLVKADQSSPNASNSEKESRREAFKREWITKNVLSLEDLQQHYGIGGRHNAGKGLGNSLARKPFEECHELQFHTPNSLAQKSFGVLDLSLWEHCINIRHLLPWRRLALKHWVRVRLKRSQDLPQTRQMNCSGGFIVQSASSFHWPTSLPDGRRIVSLSEKKIVRKTFKRKCRAMGVTFKDHQQHFSSRCDCAAKSLGAKHISKQHGINLVSTVKRIRRQHGIHRWPCRQKWATMWRYSLGVEGPVELLSLYMEERLVLKLQFLHISWLARSSRHPLALRSGSEILGHIAFSSSEFAATNNEAHPGRQDQYASGASRPEKERARKTNNGEGTASHIISREVLEQHFGKKREDVAKILGISVSTFKRVCREHGIPRWPNRRSSSVWRPPDQLEGQTTQFTAHPNPYALVFPRPQTTHMLSENDDRRNLSASRAEAVSKQRVSESSNLVFRACSDASARSQAASCVQKTVPTTTHMIPQTEGFFETLQLEGQLMQSTSYPNPNALVVPQSQTASTQMLTENMLSLEGCKIFLGLDEEPSPDGHVPCVKLKVTYRDKTIKFELPFMSGTSELKKEVEKRLKLELGSFDVEYKDEDGDWIFLGRDEDFRNHLQLCSNQVIRLLVVDSDANATNFCESCGSWKLKRP